MNNSDNQGSTWKVWDLHVHTPASSNCNDYEEFISNAKDSYASVIGINDYCTIEGYENILKIGGIPGKTLFPVVEMRMQNILETRKNPHGVKINFHIIFNNDSKILQTIKTWLASLECQDKRGDIVQLGTITENKNDLSFNYGDVIDSLKKFNLYHSHALVWLPYDEYGGIDEIDPKQDGCFKLNLIKQAHIMGSSTLKQINFFKWQDTKYSREEYQQWFDWPIPCIKGSDAHDNKYPIGHLRNEKSEPIDKYCWISADATFDGLKQIVVEPERVFIGELPPDLEKLNAHKTKYIKSLKISKEADSKVSDIWFEDFSLSFNHSLVAIIGNKGNGKSALADIIGLCGNTHQNIQNFSFLTPAKFRNPKPYNLSENFIATMEWADGGMTTKRLNENPDKSQPERVKYIPQNYLESVCTQVDSQYFEEEIKKILFSHIPLEERLDKASLDELIEYKSSIEVEEIDRIQGEISRINKEIISYEFRGSNNYLNIISSGLELKKAEYDAHEKIRPTEPPLDSTAPKDDALLERLSEIRQRIKALEIGISEKNSAKIAKSVRVAELNKAVKHYNQLGDQFKKYYDIKNEFVQILQKEGLDIATIFSFKIDTSPIVGLITELQHELDAIEDDLSETKGNSLVSLLKAAQEQLSKLEEDADKPIQLHQKYLTDLSIWEKQKVGIEGSAAIEGTLKYYEDQLDFIKTKLQPILASKYLERKEFIGELLEKKNLLLSIRKDLFSPVTKFIENYKDLKFRYDVQFNAVFELSSFPENFLEYLNQGRAGSFKGEEGSKRLLQILSHSDFSSKEGIILLIDEIVENLHFDLRNADKTPNDIESQLRKGKDIQSLYDFLFYCDYVKPVYNLNLGSKTLGELSPGERGALLLIFYLILDKDDIPLIIDQPEENLDNESVYHILVHFIKQVKQKRQIIIITHNPNLAVVCDASQIVHVQIEKDNKNKLVFYSGSIEDPKSNRVVIDVLEGTLPAFNNRDSKYMR